MGEVQAAILNTNLNVVELALVFKGTRSCVSHDVFEKQNRRWQHLKIPSHVDCGFSEL